jgi:methylmalonyl-CoA mutase N-terminal domain/subunit
MGGALKAIGWMREQLEKGSMQKDKEIEDKKRIVVGLNEFVVPPEQEVPIKVSMYRPFDEQLAVSERRAREIEELRQRRDNQRTKEALEQLWSEAQQGERHNLIPPMKEALRADATMGEILGVIRKANGYHYDPYKMIDYPF